MTASDIDKAERISKARSLIMAIAAAVLLIQAVLGVGDEASSMTPVLRNATWGIMILLWLIILATGGWLRLGSNLRSLINDEVSLVNRGLGGSQVHSVVVRGNVDWNRNRPDLRHGLPSGDEGHGGHEHFVAGTDAARFEREAQSVEAARETNAVVDSAACGERRLELADRWAIHERTGVQGVGHVSEDFVPDVFEAPGEFEKWDGAR